MVQLQRTCHPTEERVHLTNSQAMTTPAADCSGMRLRNEVLRAVGRTATVPVSRGPPKTASSCDASAGSQKRDGGYIPKNEEYNRPSPENFHLSQLISNSFNFVQKTFYSLAVRTPEPLKNRQKPNNFGGSCARGLISPLYERTRKVKKRVSGNAVCVRLS